MFLALFAVLMRVCVCLDMQRFQVCVFMFTCVRVYVCTRVYVCVETVRCSPLNR